MMNSNTPSELTDQMFAAVGRAITQWSFVEYEVSKLLALSVGGGFAITDNGGGIRIIGHLTAISIFYSVENWRSKLQMVDAAFAPYVRGSPSADDLITDWRKLSDKANDLARKRNKLAHWFVLPAQRTGTGAEHEPIAPARLCPPYGSPKFYMATGLFRKSELSMTVKQVRELEGAFSRHSMSVRKFVDRVSQDKGLRETHARLALDRLLLDDQLDQPVLEALRLVRSSLERSW